MLLGIVECVGLRGFQGNDVFRFGQIFSFHQANLHEIEVGEVQDEAGEDEDARPHLQFGTSVRFGALRLMVALRTSHFVGNGQPNGQNHMQQQYGKQAYFHHLYDDVGAHEVAECVVPFTTVMSQNEEIGAGVKQQEETQESAQSTNEDLLGDGMYLW